ncbi:berberine bridge enzyme-like 8 [Salvia splendens]|uniref:berberine bridge enzyme-like 8 n=1 Tax=Salvia splendens TaxID=180675 RepID=UPI001103571E|nr:berberine bridge enzyme-like 8 [Salvia splendens]
MNIFILPLILLLTISISQASSSSSSADIFLQCLHKKFSNYSSISSNVYTPINASFSSTVKYSIHNLRFASDSTPKPSVIATPDHESHIPPLIRCAKRSKLQIRTRSGGHDYEGLSSFATQEVPFLILDLINLREIVIDVGRKTAWVGAGATVGELYYRIAEKSPVLGFPAGIGPAVGVGGQFSGGGYGTMHRKYGLSADNVVDARIVNARGRILDRESMGENLFWAIRGGSGASFGVITAWKVRLVDVPETVTVFKVNRVLEQNATQIIHRWQSVAPEMDRDLFIGIMLYRLNSSAGNITINANFYSLFLGGANRLLAIMGEGFPELGLVREDCFEVSWLQSTVFMGGYSVDTSPEVLLDRARAKGYWKGKSNYVQEPMPELGLEGVWKLLFGAEAEFVLVAMNAYGGKMAEICDSAIPFPHRAGNLYKLLLMVLWREENNKYADSYIEWSREFDEYLTPYVSSNPRAAYLNYRDLDLGVNNVDGETSYEQASRWGKRYYKGNFDRLVRIKSVVDPKDFFKNEQSIPPVHSRFG